MTEEISFDAVVRNHGRITIPGPTREIYNLGEGTKVKVILIKVGK